MIDDTLKNISNQLLRDLPWLQKAYGRSFKLIDGATLKEYPAVYYNGLEYKSVLPDDKIGNISFFRVNDPQQQIKFGTGFKIKFEADLIFWFDTESIFEPGYADLLVDEVKFDIIHCLSKFNKYGLKINNIYERAENIYKGYSIKQVDTQYLMLPYYGYRFNLSLLTLKLC